ncbi:MAG: hypothetical protein ACRD44_06865 [Bryobacteraceae bacterium]
MNFKLFATYRLDAVSTTPILDFARNPGAAVGTTCSAGQIVDPVGDQTRSPLGAAPAGTGEFAILSPLNERTTEPARGSETP